MPRHNLPKVLVTVLANGLVNVRTSEEMRVAVVNKPRLKTLKSLGRRTFGDSLRSATRFLRKRPVAADTLQRNRDELVQTFASAASETTAEATRQVFEVPVTARVRVEARSAEEARRLAREELGLDRDDDAETGTPRVLGNAE